MVEQRRFDLDPRQRAAPAEPESGEQRRRPRLGILRKSLEQHDLCAEARRERSPLDVLRAFREILGGDEPAVRVTFDVSEGDAVIETAVSLARHHGLVMESVMTLRHAGLRLAVARLCGEAVDAFIDDLWRTVHRVLTVERETGPAAGNAR